ncbi:hypothetical protein HPB49_019236 [Dermacentor silvarum]|uniref:Uncharacterized protein n=1 Tax=Dermacentor silvarum TaxID=543639 RepID=A0ACB8DFJ5_DERSI|nr:hypothetical protein HPB49_019236 [Dermacentor silvarum]
MRYVGLPERVCNLVNCFLTQLTFAMRVAGHATGSFNAKRGVPQGSVLAPFLFNLAMLPLGWAVAAISDIYYIIYADDITVWSVHNDLQRQESALQQALNTADEWCQSIGLTLSTQKTLHMSVANSWGRRRLLDTLIHLHLSGRIFSKAGGARTKIARLLVRTVLQPRLIYSAQLQQLTAIDWARLECINREAMRVVAGLPRCTPNATLQEDAKLNTTDKLIHQRRQARHLKPPFLQLAADLAAYMGSPVSTLPSSEDTLPPWDHQQLTDNKPIGRLRNPVPGPSATFRRHMEEIDAALSTGSLVACTNARCTDIQVVTSTVVQGRPSISANYVSRLTTPVPSVSGELFAIRDATN